jgi:hypothetical protein
VTSTRLTASTISRNRIVASSSAFPATAQGGGGYVDGLKATNSTIALNKVTATTPTTSYTDGGGLKVAGTCCSIVSSTVAGNALAANGSSADRNGGGLYASGLTLRATIVANNAAETGIDCFGSPASAGHNLIRNAAGCSFTKKSTDRVGRDPKLGILRDNGGPTQTMALALTSAARNAIHKAACGVAKDQRGAHRPQGARCDIGAYERKVG